LDEVSHEKNSDFTGIDKPMESVGKDYDKIDKESYNGGEGWGGL
jgi:hypothetical protein